MANINFHIGSANSSRLCPSLQDELGFYSLNDSGHCSLKTIAVKKGPYMVLRKVVEGHYEFVAVFSSRERALSAKTPISMDRMSAEHTRSCGIVLRKWAQRNENTIYLPDEFKQIEEAMYSSSANVACDQANAQDRERHHREKFDRRRDRRTEKQYRASDWGGVYGY